MFPHRMNRDGTPNASYLDNANIDFECSKQSIICCPRCITLDTALPNEELHTCQFFLGTVHDTILLGHPACNHLNVYTLQIQNMTPKFNQHQLQHHLELDTTEAKQIPSFTSIEGLKKACPYCFDTVGNFPGEYNITVDPNVQPKEHARRKIPLELQDKIKAKLDKMEQKGIIVKEDTPTPWVNSMTSPKAQGQHMAMLGSQGS